MTRLLTLLSPFVFLLPARALAAGGGLPNPLGDTDTITELLVAVSKGLIGLVAVAATFMFIYGGVMMLTSAGNADQVKRAKEVLRWTTIGLVFIFLAGAILRYVYSVFGKTPEEDISGSLGLGQASLTLTVVNVLRVLLGVLGLAGVTMVIWSGYMWLTAGGNEQRVDRAKEILRAAIIGLVIIFLAWAIVSFTIQTGVNVTQ